MEASVITGTGSYIPSQRIPNSMYLEQEFYDSKGAKLEKSGNEIIKRFEEITGIKERRYVSPLETASHIGYLASEKAITNSGTDRESLDVIVAAHNFGDILPGRVGTDIVPSIAARVKHKLGIENPNTVAFDINFGCPGWLHALWTAHLFISSAAADLALVIGTETLSKVSDPYDRDILIYGDGAGAVILENYQTKAKVGILSYKARSDTLEHYNLLHMGCSNNPCYEVHRLFLKMDGHKVYEYALKYMPNLISDLIASAGINPNTISKFLLHQANYKMDMAIMKRLANKLGLAKSNKELMPMTISWLGNSSVATLPTLLDLLLTDKLTGYTIQPGDTIVFASVGAGMNINAMLYRFPERGV